MICTIYYGCFSLHLDSLLTPPVPIWMHYLAIIVFLKPGFHMILTIVAIATIIQTFDWTIATTLTIHGFHMIVAIATVLWLNASKQMTDILFSFLLLIVSLPILSQLLVIFFCFIKTESHSNLRILFVQGLHQGTDFPLWGIVHSVSSYNILVIWFGFLWKHCEFLAKFCPTIKLLLFIFVVPTVSISYSHTFVLLK